MKTTKEITCKNNIKIQPDYKVLIKLENLSDNDFNDFIENFILDYFFNNSSEDDYTIVKYSSGPDLNGYITVDIVRFCDIEDPVFRGEVGYVGFNKL